MKMSSKLNVAVGDKVAILSGWGDRETVDGIATVKSISASGRVTITDLRPSTYRRENGRTYESDGYPRGDAPGRIRPLREDENADEILAAKEATINAVIAKKVAERTAAEAREQAAFDKCLAWVVENYAMTTLDTIATPLYIVELNLVGHPCTLVMRFTENKSTWDGNVDYRVEIMVNHQRGEYMDGGITSTTVKTIDPLGVAAGWVKNWVGVENI
jgi:hypothetical protein